METVTQREDISAPDAAAVRRAAMTRQTRSSGGWCAMMDARVKTNGRLCERIVRDCALEVADAPEACARRVEAQMMTGEHDAESPIPGGPAKGGDDSGGVLGEAAAADDAQLAEGAPAEPTDVRPRAGDHGRSTALPDTRPAGFPATNSPARPAPNRAAAP